MLTLLGFICLFYLPVLAVQAIKREWSPEWRRERKEAERVLKESDELLSKIDKN